MSETDKESKSFTYRPTHCPKGHPYTDDNLMPSGLKVGVRRCVTCNREHSRKYNRIRRAAVREGVVFESKSTRTHCKEGHELTESNLVVSELSKGSRLCRLCRNRKAAEYQKRRRSRATGNENGEQLGPYFRRYLDTR